MGILGNVLWFIFGGAIGGLSWCLTGCLWCITVIGIPVGLQCFKLASLSFFPFGKEVRYGGRRRLLSSERDLASGIGASPGPGACGHGPAPLCDHSGDPLRSPAV